MKGKMKTLMMMMIVAAMTTSVFAETTKLKRDPTATAVVAKYLINNEHIANIEYTCLKQEDLIFTIGLYTEIFDNHVPFVTSKNVGLDPEVAKITKKHGNSKCSVRYDNGNKIMIVFNVYYEPLDIFSTWTFFLDSADLEGLEFLL